MSFSLKLLPMGRAWERESDLRSLRLKNPNIKKNYNLCLRHSKHATVKSIESYQNLKLLETAIKINLEKV
ncbi:MULTISPECIES: hypothetical protein [unclassified Microcoleus]|uniref:hypothetical protein n=1 Tax=unclassified Microcoleus TaxID=2642155 RepID=UPI002FD0BF23